ncbi:amidase [Tuwongella immobilis]|uniref:Amidase domain-containing protein n=1 Tax=Tuwongella immobilis TaxID=692036 RepID=A0A6C2YU12_9BACT|nr:amidase [Tuwongella immobilis]VIP04976.1 glutamyl-trna amidotransferase : Amidase, Asp-tRNAAsn/Glu-tRNAGln amidotransferase A subunit OS=Singulisphaera acidiphila (strain ATCC BAA-1392 / DSM 18658 / VKM B-2454 / MOB10) GN=Sinac_6362 PE=4 SV=1: Amidase [Tuwongella immobilis]VTS07310.1 glutamyl-trna amidotransferase : Amidase, Asp-tRNAAsn/Glu-tRNAGln amidotransferase A subunit OS=Singulisphaera acidiphila (strain ATCC BAA-1392 / DSM 18658 / VKM B-2454 / MOB10) GN=Sinac_6362 PE=4 SV=1: Amidase [T
MMPPTIEEAADAIRDERLTPIELLEICLNRIDACESAVQAWQLIDRESAREQAERLTREQASGTWRGPLHGIPIGVKDIIDVFEWPTTAGSARWAQAIARQDAAVIAQLRHAGAILVGKTVTTPFAGFDPARTRNPWNLNHSPGGSSSGSAAAVAAGMCLAALATQTGGSITRPASFCGVPALKPSFGRVSMHGIVPVAQSLDHVGIITRTIGDLGVMLEAMASNDPQLATPLPPLEIHSSRDDDHEFVPLGRLRGFFDQRVSPEVQSCLDDACETLLEEGYLIHDFPTLPEFGEVLAQHRIIMAVEAAQFHQSRFARHPNDYPPHFAQLIQSGLTTSATDYARARSFQERFQLRLQRYFDDCRVLLTPATVTTAPLLTSTGDPAFNAPWSLAGLPTVSFPIGLAPNGLPIAMQLIGAPAAEMELLAIARTLERTLSVELPTPMSDA